MKYYNDVNSKNNRFIFRCEVKNFDVYIYKDIERKRVERLRRCKRAIWARTMYSKKKSHLRSASGLHVPPASGQPGGEPGGGGVTCGSCRSAPNEAESSCDYLASKLSEVLSSFLRQMRGEVYGRSWRRGFPTSVTAEPWCITAGARAASPPHWPRAAPR